MLPNGQDTQIALHLHGTTLPDGAECDLFVVDGRLTANYRAGTLAEAARRVQAAGGRIAIHSTCPDAISHAIEAGFDSLEHGVGLNDEHIKAMVARQIVLVPTLVILPGITQWIQSMNLPAAVSKPILDSLKRHPEMTRRAAEAGVTVLAGTDAGMSPHGIVGQEVGLLKAAGIPQEIALGAGCWTARRYLGFAVIAEGAPADLVAYASDPRSDPEALGRPVVRMLNGRVVRNA